MAKTSDNFRSPLKKVRGLGAAHSGVHHFWVLRVSALALVPLSIWFVVSLLQTLMAADRAGVAAWLQNPVTAILLALFIAAMFVHSRLGITEIIEDYVQCKAKKFALIIFNSGIHLVLGFAGLVAIARLHFGL